MPEGSSPSAHASLENEQLAKILESEGRNCLSLYEPNSWTSSRSAGARLSFRTALIGWSKENELDMMCCVDRT